MASLTEDQVAAIVALQLTNANLQTYYVEIGVSELKTPELGITPQICDNDNFPLLQSTTESLSV